MKVVKFGGSSMANAAQIKKVCDIVLSDSERRIMVVSAPGKRDENDTKVTDMLIDLASAVISKEEYNEKLEAVYNSITSSQPPSSLTLIYFVLKTSLMSLYYPSHFLSDLAHLLHRFLFFDKCLQFHSYNTKYHQQFLLRINNAHYSCTFVLFDNIDPLLVS